MGKEVQAGNLVAMGTADALTKVEADSLTAGQQRQRTHQPSPPTSDIVKAIAMDIGKELVDYVERMYPDAIEAASSTFRLSLRNHVYNDIMCMVKITDEERLKEWLDYREKFRRYMRRMKKAKSTDEADRIWKQAPVNPAMKW